MKQRQHQMTARLFLTPERRLPGSSVVAQAAFRRGNAAGLHGGRKPKYGKRERQAAHRTERHALREGWS